MNVKGQGCVRTGHATISKAVSNVYVTVAINYIMVLVWMSMNAIVTPTFAIMAHVLIQKVPSHVVVMQALS